MYEVKIINNDKESIINAVSTDINAPRCKGTIKQGINVIDSFTVTILHNNPCFFDSIKEKITRVEVLNTISNKLEFSGRFLIQKKLMETNGNLQKEYICESSLGYLRDSVQTYGEYHDMSVKNYLKMLLDNHNLQVEDYKKIKLGNVTVEDNLYRYTSYKTTWENINEDLINKLDGEIQLRYELDGIYLDYLKEIGFHSDTSIRVAHNMKSIENQANTDDFPTRIIPLGAKKEDSEERLTIEDVNNGKIYIDYDDGIKTYGVNPKFVEFDDVTQSDNLLAKGKEYIDNLKLSITNKLEVLDLSLLGIDKDSFHVGNYHNIENSLLDISYELRIVEKTINIESPEKIALTFGDKKVKLNDRQVKIKQLEQDYINLLAKVNTFNGALNSVSGEITEASKEIGQIQSSLSSYITIEVYNNFIQTYNDFVKTVNDRLDGIETRLNTLEGGGTVG